MRYHYEKPENYSIVNQVLSEALGENIKARFTVDKGKEKEKSPEHILAENIDDSMLEIYDE